MTEIIIVENVKTIREGLETLINASNEFRCTGAFRSFDLFSEKYSSLNPGIILMDLNLPGISGIEGIKRLQSLSENYSILVLTVYEENERIFEAITAGAVGYLVKNTPPDKMIQIIKDVSEGRGIMNSFIARKALDYFYKTNSYSSLSKLEAEVLKKLVEGHNIKAIENCLNIDMSEIKIHYKNIYKKLHNGAIIAR